MTRADTHTFCAYITYSPRANKPGSNHHWHAHVSFRFCYFYREVGGGRLVAVVVEPPICIKMDYT